MKLFGQTGAGTLSGNSASGSGSSAPAAMLVGLTGDASIDGLIDGWIWNTRSLGYTFPTKASFYPDGYTERDGFLSANPTLRVITKNVLANYSEVSQLKFTELEANDKNAALNIAMTYLNNDDGTKKYDGYGYSPGDPKHSGDVWIHRQYADGYGYFVDSFLYNLVLHEVGHAVGLKHPHEGTITSPLVHDQHEFSIMSYRSYAGAPLGATNDSGSFPQSLMMDDIAALQQMA